MKIGIDAHPILSSTKAGIGYNESEIIKAMFKMSADDDRFTLNYFDPKPNNPKKEFIKEYMSDKVGADCCRWFSVKLYRLIWRFIPLPYSLFFKEKNQATLFFNFYLPPLAPGKKFLEVHDMVIKDCPETMRFKTKMMLRLLLKSSIKRADKIFTVSEFSKKRIMEHFGVDESDIIVIHNAADRSKFYPLDGKEDVIESAKSKYGISGSYFFYLGTLEPRKNIVRLVEAYIEARKRKSDLPKLVLAGGKGWLYDDIFSKANSSQYKDDIIFTGYVDDEDVPVLMNGANAFCFPSLYEGFGMPPLEAMACGTPAIVSNTSSLPEVAGDCGIAVDPYSVEEITKALIIASDENFKKSQREKCLKRADAFSWEKSAETLYGEIKKAIGE